MMYLKPISRTAVTLLVALLPVQATLPAQDWPQWRGPNRDGIVRPFHEPKSWPEQLRQKWQAAVGTGHSSPILVGRSIYLITRQGEEEVVACLDFDTGKVLWRDAYPAPYTMNRAATSHGKGPKSTPVFHAGRLYTLGISGTLSCYDAAAGKLVWRREFASQYPSTSPYYGTATSPLVEQGRLIAHVGGHDNGALTAFDAATGKTVWSWNGDGPAYASAIAVDLTGSRQIVTQSQKNVVGLSAADGRLLWSIPFTTPYVQNIVTPVFYKETLIFSGLDNSVRAVKLEQSGGKWKAESVWENSEASFYMSTPVLHGDVLFGMSNKRRGQFVALDARTGVTLWATDGGAGENAAVLTAGEKLFFLTNNAELIVARAVGTGFEQVRRYTVAGSPTWAHPLLAGTTILVKDAERLTSWIIE